MNRMWIRFICGTSVLLLIGCGYPQERRQQLDRLPEQVHQVQQAVDQYYKNHRVLPYRYSVDEYKLSTKYLVDFRELSGQLSQYPSSCFEKGGYFIYVLTEVDRVPMVKLFDLRLQDIVERVQLTVEEYIKQKRALPIQEKISPHMYSVDLNKLELADEKIHGPYYPGENRGFLVDESGRVYVDYRQDVMRMLQEKNFKLKGLDDLRVLLSRNSFYVPAYSPIIKYSQGNLALIPLGK